MVFSSAAVTVDPTDPNRLETTISFDRCEHCQQPKDAHGDDEKCLFEASSYEPQKLDVKVFTMTWEIVKAVDEPPKKPRPYPAMSEAQRRKERRLRERAYKPPR